MKINSLMLLGLFGLWSCSSPEPTAAPENKEAVITFNTFEGLDGWLETPPSVNKERAFSGKYSIKTDGNNEFSFGYQKQLGQVTNGRPKSLRLTAMAFVPSKAKGDASLVFSLTNPERNEQVLYEEIKLAELGVYRKWVKVEKVINLPDNANYTDVVKIYLWRGQASEPVYIDDLKLSVIY